MTIDRSTRVLVSGHRGLVGSVLVRRLQAEGNEQLPRVSRVVAAAG